MHQEATQLATFFKSEYPLNEHGLDELFSLFKKQRYSKGDILLQKGAKEKYLRFLNDGIVREYYAQDTIDTNINFYTRPQFITDLLAFKQNVPTHKNQECLSPAEILIIERQCFLDLLQKYQCGKSFVDQSFQRLLQQKELMEFNRVTKGPDELYRDLVRNRPEWLQVIPQYHIASYLNITPETLSRIRKRIS